MSNKKQSSITHIRSWVRTNGEMSEDGKSITYSCAELESVIRVAEAMHKEEVQDAYNDGAEERHNNPVNGEDYYNETFGGNDKNSIGEKLYTKDEVLDLLVNMNSWPTTFEGREDITEWFEQGQYY